MPVYEFLCKSCHRKSSFFTKSIKEPLAPACPACNSSSLVRVISSFTHPKSLQTIREEAGEPRMFAGSDYYKDPRNIGRWAERRVKELGLEMPSQVDEMILAAREGEMPPSLKEPLV